MDFLTITVTLVGHKVFLCEKADVFHDPQELAQIIHAYMSKILSQETIQQEVFFGSTYGKIFWVNFVKRNGCWISTNRSIK